MNLPDFKTHFDNYLHDRLEKKLISVQSLFPDQKTFQLLTYLNSYVDHGKRFRPYMVYLWYSLYGGEDIEYITKVGLVSEIIHIFALIHDDICDQGTMRHGIPTYHKHLAEKYENPYIWDVQAMLVWDLVYTRALQEACELLSGTHAHTIVLDLINEVVIGQMLDIDYSATSTLRSSQDIAHKDHLKSGQYTFQKPMMIWASLAWVQDFTDIESLGKNIWIAFQMRDDVLDRIPNNEGKTKMSDIQEWNQTAVMLACKETYNQNDRDFLRSHKGKTCEQQTLDRLQDDFQKYKIQDIVIQKIAWLLDEASSDFKKLDLSNEFTSNFEEIVDLLRSV